jgi:hypothetical protein
VYIDTAIVLLSYTAQRYRIGVIRKSHLERTAHMTSGSSSFLLLSSFAPIIIDHGKYIVGLLVAHLDFRLSILDHR